MIHNSARPRSIFIFLTLYILTAGSPAPSTANERLRIAGMGHTRIATHAVDAGIFGNPASLVHVQNNNVAFGIGTENLRWAELPKHGTDQFAAEATLDVYPSGYYSRAFGEWGISVGHAATLTHFANVTLSATDAQYDRGARQLSAKTDLFTDYALFHEGRWIVGLSRAIGKSLVGARLKWVVQDVKQGVVVSTLNLAARHGPNIDVQAPEQLIAAIVDELQFGDRVREIVHEPQPTLDRKVRGLELDVGVQHEVSLGTLHAKPVQVGVLFENLFRADLVEPRPFRFGIGVAYKPLEWITVAADVSRRTGHRGVDFAIGGEVQKAWKGISPNAIALRIGAGIRDTTPYFAIGIALRLGTLSTEYTLSRLTAELPLTEARHLLAFTLHF